MCPPSTLSIWHACSELMLRPTGAGVHWARHKESPAQDGPGRAKLLLAVTVFRWSLPGPCCRSTGRSGLPAGTRVGPLVPPGSALFPWQQLGPDRDEGRRCPVA